MRETVDVGPNEPCYWACERVVVAPQTGFPIRVQQVVVRRGGDLVMHTELMDAGVNLPPIEFNAGGAVTVDAARAHLDTVRNERVELPPPITVTIGGETFIEADHPALEVIPDASPNDPS